MASKYLNNIVGQNQRFIKKSTKPMLSFKNFRLAQIIITVVENIRMIWKGQIIMSNDNLSTFEYLKMFIAV